jgi:hypothetical protein
LGFRLSALLHYVCDNFNISTVGFIVKRYLQHLSYMSQIVAACGLQTGGVVFGDELWACGVAIVEGIADWRLSASTFPPAQSGGHEYSKGGAVSRLD